MKCVNKKLIFEFILCSEFKKNIYIFPLLLMNDITSTQTLFATSDQVNTGVYFTGSQIDPSVENLVISSDSSSLLGLATSHQI